MYRPVRVLALLAACLLPVVGGAQEDRGSEVRTFAVLPEILANDPNDPGELLPVGHPEGITADSRGNVYAATFEVDQPNFIYIFNPLGGLSVSLPIPQGRAPLGMVTNEQFLYVNDVLNGDILRYQLPVTNRSEPFV